MIVSVGQITIVDMNDVTISTVQPVNPTVDQLWLDSSVVPNQLKRWTGTEWAVINDSSSLSDTVENLVNTVSTMSTELNQTVDGLRTEVSQTFVKTSDLSTYKNEVSTALTQTKNSFVMDFNNLTTSIEEVDSKSTTEFSEIHKHIRFVDGKIMLGEEGNLLTLEIQNDRISFMQSTKEVAYFSNNKLTVLDGNFLNSLQIGNFSFKPRTNGSLAFSKVV